MKKSQLKALKQDFLKLSDAQGIVIELLMMQQRWAQAKAKELEKVMEHGDEGTHFVCDKKLKEEGGNAKCCGCFPHEGCDL